MTKYLTARILILSALFSMAGAYPGPTPPFSPGVPEEWVTTLLKVPGVSAEIGLPSAGQSAAANLVSKVGGIDSAILFATLFPSQEKDVAPQGKVALSSDRSRLIREFMSGLTQDQQRRLSELYLQKAGSKALLYSGLQASLILTAVQAAKISALTQQADKNDRDYSSVLTTTLVDVATGKISQAQAQDRDDTAKARNSQQKAACDRALMAVLTPAQRSWLEILKGTPFPFPPDKS